MKVQIVHATDVGRCKDTQVVEYMCAMLQYYDMWRYIRIRCISALQLRRVHLSSAAMHCTSLLSQGPDVNQSSVLHVRHPVLVTSGLPCGQYLV